VTKPWLARSDANSLADYLNVEFLELPLESNALKAGYEMTKSKARSVLRLERKMRSLYFRGWKPEDR